MKKAIIITGKFVQDPEFIYPYYRLEEAGFEVDVATEDGQNTFGVNGNKVLVNKSFSDLKGDDYSALVIPGGARAMEYIRQNELAIKFIEEWNEKGKPIACICHGTQLLITAGAVKGKKISGYYSIKDDIVNAGGTYIDAPAVIDGNIVTSPHYKYMGEWMKEFLKLVS